MTHRLHAEAIRSKGVLRSHLDRQQVSEFSAIGAPTRPLWVGMLNFFAPLMIAFGVGVILSARGRLSLKIAGSLMVVAAAIGRLWPPMNPRGNTGSTTDVLHLVFAGVAAFLMVPYIALASGADGRWFRVYSIATIMAMLAGGVVVSAVAVPAMAADGLVNPTSWRMDCACA